VTPCAYAHASSVRDLLISTLRGYVEAMGGRLSLIAEFPNQDPVVLAGLAAIESAKTDG
jgi:hypothetical protein